MAETDKIEILPYDAKVKIEISGGFYARLIDLAVSLAAEQGIEDLVKIMNELQNREPKTKYEYNLVTVLALTNSIETAAKEQKLLEVRDLPNPEDDTEETAPGS